MSATTDTLIPAQPAPAPPPKAWTASRISGTLLVLFWIAAAIGLDARPPHLFEELQRPLQLHFADSLASCPSRTRW